MVQTRKHNSNTEGKNVNKDDNKIVVMTKIPYHKILAS